MSHNISFIAYFHLCELNTCQIHRNHDFKNFMFMNHFCGLFVNTSSLSDYYNIINKNQKDSENDCRIAVMFSLSQYLHLIQRHKSVANLSSQCRCLLYEYCIMCHSHSTISAVSDYFWFLNMVHHLLHCLLQTPLQHCSILASH